jgi:hypothetical protein
MRELIRATLYGVLDLHVFDSNCDGNSMDLLQAVGIHSSRHGSKAYPFGSFC